MEACIVSENIPVIPQVLDRRLTRTKPASNYAYIPRYVFGLGGFKNKPGFAKWHANGNSARACGL